jgi:hypothetical protein
MRMMMQRKYAAFLNLHNTHGALITMDISARNTADQML